MTLEPMEAVEPKKTGHRWVDLFVAFSALFISALSIFMGQQTGASMERLVHASSWPFVQLGSGNATLDGQRELSFGAENVGTGPARIHTYTMTVDGEPLPQDGHLLTNLLRACCDEEFRAASARAGSDIAAMGYEMSSPVGARFLAPNADVYAIKWPRSEENHALWTAADMARQHGRITTSVCYCSVFDECWIAHSNAFPPEDVSSCTPGEAPPHPR
jgi:hypothetical protein